MFENDIREQQKYEKKTQKYVDNTVNGLRHEIKFEIILCEKHHHRHHHHHSIPSIFFFRFFFLAVTDTKKRRYALTKASAVLNTGSL